MQHGRHNGFNDTPLEMRMACPEARDQIRFEHGNSKVHAPLETPRAKHFAQEEIPHIGSQIASGLGCRTATQDLAAVV
jgi:hypothetical protein